MTVRTLQRLAAVLAVGAAAIPAAPAGAAPTCNSTSEVGSVDRVTVCAEAMTASNLAEASVEWCLDWSFPCQTSEVTVPYLPINVGE